MLLGTSWSGLCPLQKGQQSHTVLRLPELTIHSGRQTRAVVTGRIGTKGRTVPASPHRACLVVPGRRAILDSASRKGRHVRGHITVEKPEERQVKRGRTVALKGH